MTNNGMKRNDPYGLIKYIMAICISIMHYWVLVGDPTQEVGDSNALILVLNRLFMDFSKKTGGKLPIGFFVLSGFAIYKAYYKKIFIGEINYVDYIIKRIKRLFPTMWISIFIWGGAQWIYYLLNDEWWTGRDSSLWNILVSCTGLSVGTFVNTLDTVNGPIWYISVLLICYSVFYWLIVLEKKYYEVLPDNYRWALYALPIMLGFAIDYYDFSLPFLNKSTSCGYIGFFVGVVICRLIDEKRVNIFAFSSVVLSWTELLLFIIGFVILRDNLWILLGNTSYIFAFFVFPALIMLVERNKERGILDNFVNNICGKCSFYYYLLHMPLFLCLSICKTAFGIDYNIRIALLVCMAVSVIAYGLGVCRIVFKNKHC